MARGRRISHWAAELRAAAEGALATGIFEQMAGAVKRYMEIELPRQIRRKVEEDTGQLLDSIRYVVKRDGEDSVTVSMTISAPYTRFLEYGTQYMPPKRFVKNTRQNVRRNIRRGLEAAFFAVLGGEGEQ